MPFRRDIIGKMDKSKSAKPRFDFKAVFEPDDYLYFYSDMLTEERTRKEIDFLVRVLNLDRPRRILDLACGYGRHANRLAKLGHKVVGVDITPGFLKIARREARQKRLKVRYIRQDMRKIYFKEEFDCALLLFTAFGYFEDAENFKVLKNIARSLKPGGLFCFDSFNHSSEFIKKLPWERVTEKGRDLMIDRASYDPPTQRIYNRRIVIRRGKRKDKPFFVRVYKAAEIKQLPAKAGMRFLKIFGDWDGRKFTRKSQRIIVIAQKPQA